MGNDTNTNTAVATSNKQLLDLKGMLLKALPSLQGIATKRLDPERMVRIALVAASRRPDLLKCTATSILSALMQAAQVGLEPETPLQHAYLVPFKNNKNGGNMEAQLQIGYKGLILMGKRSGDVAKAWSRVVFRGELFRVKHGTTEEIVHEPHFDDSGDGEMIAVYAVVEFKDGTKDFEVMNKEQVDRIRARSRASDSGPWVTDYLEMCRKTVLRRLYKRIPMESETLAEALAHEDAQERDDDRPNAAVIPLLAEQASEQATRSEQLADDIKRKKQAEKEAKAKAEVETKSEAPAQGKKESAPEQQSLPGSAPIGDEEKRRIQEEEKRAAAKERTPGGDDE